MNKCFLIFTFLFLSYSLKANERAAYEFSRAYKAIDNLDLKFKFNSTISSLRKTPFASFNKYFSSVSDSSKYNPSSTLAKCEVIEDLSSNSPDMLENSLRKKIQRYCVELWISKRMASKTKSQLSESEQDFLISRPFHFFDLKEDYYLSILENDIHFKNRLIEHLLSKQIYLSYLKLFPIEGLSSAQMNKFHMLQNSQEEILGVSKFSREMRRDIYRAVNKDEVDSDYFRYLARFVDLNLIQDSFVEDLALDNIFRSLISRGLLEESYLIHTQLAQSKNSSFRNRSLLGLIITSLNINNPKYYQKMISQIKPEDYAKDSDLAFWVAKYFNKVGLISNASNIFEQIISKNPLSYYSTISLKFLNTKSLNFESSRELASSFRVSPTVSNLGDRYRAWNKMGQQYFKELEIRSLLNFLEQKSIGSIEFDLNLDYVMDLFQEEGDYLSLFKTYYDLISRRNYVIKERDLQKLFPRKYEELITRNARKINPDFVLSIMRQESTFNPRSYSSAGAMGLLQLLPSTAKEHVKFKRRQELYEPALNVKAGVKFLERLSRKYDGDLIKILAAYNAGEGNVKRWLDRYLSHEDPFITVEMIPFDETRNYVKLIYRNYFFYNFIQGNEEFLLAPFSENIKISEVAN